jgi:hypothetical protein
MDLNDSTDDGSGGWMPMWLYVKTIGTAGARSVLSMRNVLIAEAEERKQQHNQHTRPLEEIKAAMELGFRKLPGVDFFQKKMQEEEQQRGEEKRSGLSWKLPGLSLFQRKLH